MKRIILWVTTLALACGLMLGTVGGAMASTAQSGEGRGLFGTVESVDISDDGGGLDYPQQRQVAECRRQRHDRGNGGHGTTVYHIPTVTLVPRWQTWAGAHRGQPGPGRGGQPGGGPARRSRPATTSPRG